MNIHPLFVHFPIALLCIYSLLEMIPMMRWFPQVQWDVLKKGSLYLGAVSTVPTVLTGLMAAEIIGETEPVEMHEKAALTTSTIFIILAGIYFYHWYTGRPMAKEASIILRVGAFLGFLGMFVVGALGANIVYGPEVDPIVWLVTKIFGLQ